MKDGRERERHSWDWKDLVDAPWHHHGDSVHYSLSLAMTTEHNAEEVIRSVGFGDTFLSMLVLRDGEATRSPAAVYGKNGRGNPPIFQFFFIFCALFFGKLHKGTPHYTKKGINKYKFEVFSPLRNERAGMSPLRTMRFSARCLGSIQPQLSPLLFLPSRFRGCL